MDMYQPYSVLLVVSTQNNPDGLLESLHSLVDQSLLPDEILVIENGVLSPPLLEALTSFRKEHPGLVRSIPLEQEESMGVALGKGVKACHNDFIIRAQPDDISLPTRCEIQISHLQNKEELVICGGRVGVFNDTPDNIMQEYSAPLTDEDIRKFSKKRNPFQHTTVCFRKGAVLNAGNYQEMPWFEDYWLWIRLLKEGRAENIDQVLVLANGGNKRIASRGGWTVAKHSISFQKTLWKYGHTNFGRYLGQSSIRLIESFLPSPLRMAVYNRRLRTREESLQSLVVDDLSQELEVIKVEEGGLSMPIVKKVDEFLTKYGQHHNTIDMNKETDTYQNEMKNGLASNGNSTLMMLPTFIAVNDAVPYDEPIIVIDAGGTNFRIAVVTFRKNNVAKIDSFQKYKMPGTEGAISRQEFFETIAQRLLPVIDQSQRIGFCFSYPTTILPNKDGQFIEFSKEVCVSDMEGAILGQEINKALAVHEIAPKKFLVLNDSVAAMLGDMGSEHGSNYDGYMGFILGTGFNTCYAEKATNITKNTDAMAQGGEMAINVETGGYGKFSQGELDRRFDSTTNNPGSYTCEKMISGAYHGAMLHVVVTQAIADGLFSSEFEQNFSIKLKNQDNEQLSSIPLWEVNDFLDSPTGDNLLSRICFTTDDRETLEAIFTASFERAAKFVTVCLGATLRQMEKGTDPSRPVCIVTEGTTIEKSRVLRAKLDEQVKAFIQEELNLYCELRKVEDVTLLGTAVAGLIG